MGWRQRPSSPRAPVKSRAPKTIANIARTIEREGIPAVFVEPQAEEESGILEQAAEDAGVKVCTPVQRFPR